MLNETVWQQKRYGKFIEKNRKNTVEASELQS